jgi:hypothetical protein
MVSACAKYATVKDLIPIFFLNPYNFERPPKIIDNIILYKNLKSLFCLLDGMPHFFLYIALLSIILTVDPVILNNRFIDEYGWKELFFQILPNIKSTNPNFKTLENKIKITLNFKVINWDLIKIIKWN